MTDPLKRLVHAIPIKQEWLDRMTPEQRAEFLDAYLIACRAAAVIPIEPLNTHRDHLPEMRTKDDTPNDQ